MLHCQTVSELKSSYNFHAINTCTNVIITRTGYDT